MAEHTEYVEDGADDVIEETTTVTPDTQDDIQTGEIDAVTTQDESDDTIEDDELHQFERRIDEILATGELDETLRVIDEKGVAQVLPVLDTEPISHLLEGIEEIGGRANVFVRTADGIAVLSVAEYSPQNQEDAASSADDTPTGETPVVDEAQASVTTTEED
ncbi:hypothetical protein CGZ88_0963 [Bifidobacterium anseris]|uniref:Uncharacterized protein n=1 Tax=Bifidobacterium anseris TaxID=2020963 RepID=A0A2N5IZQ2_9BIFI|nr:hypothetical protein CGZ88_0963 [Bifidobacterium anseris]